MSRPKKETTETEEIVKIDKHPTLIVEFLWQEARPDSRQFRQNSILLQPQFLNVGITVPLTAEYIANSDDIILNQLNQGGKALPLLTPKGLRFCLDQLNKEFEETPVEEKETDGVKWEDEKEETITKENAKFTNDGDDTEWSDTEDGEEETTEDMNETDFQWDD